MVPRKSCIRTQWRTTFAILRLFTPLVRFTIASLLNLQSCKTVPTHGQDILTLDNPQPSGLPRVFTMLSITPCLSWALMSTITSNPLLWTISNCSDPTFTTTFPLTLDITLSEPIHWLALALSLYHTLLTVIIETTLFQHTQDIFINNTIMFALELANISWPTLTLLPNKVHGSIPSSMISTQLLLAKMSFSTLALPRTLTRQLTV